MLQPPSVDSNPTPQFFINFRVSRSTSQKTLVPVLEFMFWSFFKNRGKKAVLSLRPVFS